VLAGRIARDVDDVSAAAGVFIVKPSSEAAADHRRRRTCAIAFVRNQLSTHQSPSKLEAHGSVTLEDGVVGGMNVT